MEYTIFIPKKFKRQSYDSSVPVMEIVKTESLPADNVAEVIAVCDEYGKFESFDEHQKVFGKTQIAQNFIFSDEVSEKDWKGDKKLYNGNLKAGVVKLSDLYA